MGSRRAVVVTGASTGIGRATCLRLATSGWDVIAGVRTESDRVALGALERVDGVILDVADEASVATAADHIAAIVGSRGLAGLVNNAGIVVAGPLETLTRRQWLDQFEVNLFGAVDVTRALLPLLDAAVDARVVMIGSISGRVGAPLLSPYVASKHALDGVVKCLRREFDGNGPTVVLVEPGAVLTPLWDKADTTADNIESTLDDRQRARYSRFIAAHRAAVLGRTRGQRTTRSGVEPDAVAAIIETALTVSRPRARYLVGRDALTGGVLQRLAPDVVMESIGRAMTWRSVGDRRFDRPVSCRDLDRETR